MPTQSSSAVFSIESSRGQGQSSQVLRPQSLSGLASSERRCSGSIVFSRLASESLEVLASRTSSRIGTRTTPRPHSSVNTDPRTRTANRILSDELPPGSLLFSKTVLPSSREVLRARPLNAVLHESGFSARVYRQSGRFPLEKCHLGTCAGESRVASYTLSAD